MPIDQMHFHYRLLIIPFTICLFMYADTYLVPTKEGVEYVSTPAFKQHNISKQKK